MYQCPIRPNELYHFGIMGMKWGVRRYQNPDGSLTAEGQRHYNIGEAKAKVNAAEKRRRAAANTYTSEKNKIAVTKAGRVEKDKRVADAEKKLNDAKAEVTKSKQELKQTKKDNPLTDKQKKQIMVAGAAVVATGLAVYGGYKLSGEVKKWKKTRELVDSYTFHRTMEDMAKGHEKYYKNAGDMSKAADSFNNARVMRQQKHNDQVQMAEFIEKQLKKKVPHDMYVFN